LNYLLVIALPAPTTKGNGGCSPLFVSSSGFVLCMESMRVTEHMKKPAATQPAFSDRFGK
jgi:hypothetical protein